MDSIQESNYMVPGIGGFFLLAILVVTIVFIYLTVGTTSSFTLSTFNIISAIKISLCVFFLYIIWTNKDEDNSGWIAATVVVLMACSMSSWIGAYLWGIRGISQAPQPTPAV